MKTIMCYGDSNTFGTNPHGGRWRREVRWTGKLQQLLGDQYYVIEEGCGGRTTVWNDDLELFKNGRKSLPVALATHKPIDLVIIMLGTNDCKTRFQALPCDIAEGVRQLAELVQMYPYGEWYKISRIAYLLGLTGLLRRKVVIFLPKCQKWQKHRSVIS